LVFEDSGDFPTNRSELYREGIAILLKKWDATRAIERDQVYSQLSVQRKEDLLSQVALTTFERGDYFFKQRDVERYIADYIRNLPDAQTDPEALQLDSEVVLKSIEAQHGLLVERARGIYSFSHLTFQEYFTARKIVTTSNPYLIQDRALQSLVSHIAEKRWREVFLVAIEMLPSADCLLLLMKKQIDALVADDEKLQQFLMWVIEKSFSVEVPYKPAAVRAFYLTRTLDCFDVRSRGNTSLDLDFALEPDLSFDIARVSARVRALELALDVELFGGRGSNLVRAIDFALKTELTPDLKQALQQLKDELPNSDIDKEVFEQWWQVYGHTWAVRTKSLMLPHRKIGHNWQFSVHQKDVLKQYYDTNLFLVECLNSDCYVSREVRSHIEDTLLLPIAEIEKRKLGD
jgi:predicted NACHT family NTPase